MCCNCNCSSILIVVMCGTVSCDVVNVKQLMVLVVVQLNGYVCVGLDVNIISLFLLVLFSTDASCNGVVPSSCRLSDVYPLNPDLKHSSQAHPVHVVHDMLVCDVGIACVFKSYIVFLFLCY